MYRKRFAAVVLFMAAMMLAGCYCMPSFPAFQTSQESTPNLSGEIRENVQLLTDSELSGWNSSILKTDSDEWGNEIITVSKDNPTAINAQVDDIYVFDSSITGNAIKVTGREEDADGNIVLHTETPALDDLFDSLNADITKEVNPEDIVATYLMDGVTLQSAETDIKGTVASLGNAAPAAKPAKSGTYSFMLKVDTSIVLPGSGNSKLKIEGEYGIKDLTLDFNAKIEKTLPPDVQQLSLDVGFTTVMDSAVKFSTSGEASLFEFPNQGAWSNRWWKVRGVDLGNKLILGIAVIKLASIPIVSPKWNTTALDIGGCVYLSLDVSGKITAEAGLFTKLNGYVEGAVNVQHSGYNGPNGDFNPALYENVANAGDFQIGTYLRTGYSKEEKERSPQYDIGLSGQIEGEPTALLGANAGVLVFGIVPVNVSFRFGIKGKANAALNLNATFYDGQFQGIQSEASGVEADLNFTYGIRAEAAMQVIKRGKYQDTVQGGLGFSCSAEAMKEVEFFKWPPVQASPSPIIPETPQDSAPTDINIPQTEMMGLISEVLNMDMDGVEAYLGHEGDFFEWVGLSDVDVLDGAYYFDQQFMVVTDESNRVLWIESDKGNDESFAYETGGARPLDVYGTRYGMTLAQVQQILGPATIVKEPGESQEYTITYRINGMSIKYFVYGGENSEITHIEIRKAN